MMVGDVYALWQGWYMEAVYAARSRLPAGQAGSVLPPRAPPSP